MYIHAFQGETQEPSAPSVTDRALMLRRSGFGVVPLNADGREMVKGTTLALSVVTLAIEGVHQAFKRAKGIGLAMGHCGWIGFGMKHEDASRLRTQLDIDFTSPFLTVHIGGEEIDIRRIPEWPAPSYRLLQAGSAYLQACLDLWWLGELEDQSAKQLADLWGYRLDDPYFYRAQRKPAFIRTKKILDKLLARHIRINGPISSSADDGTGLRILSFGEFVQTEQ